VPKDKRRYQRINIRVPVELVLSSGETITVTSANLSAGGVAISYEVPADSGARFKLSFSITIADRPAIVDVDAQVVHHYFSGEHSQYVIGMAFKRISDEHQLLVDHYVQSIDRMRS